MGTETIAAVLERHVGAGQVLSDSSSLSRYSHDASTLSGLCPEAVVLPERAEEVAAVLRLCYELGVPVTPRGAGTGLTGGAVPTRGSVVLSTERMRKIKEIDSESFVVTVEPGVITGELQRTLEGMALFYPPDPASLEACSIGGNVAHNAGGPRALKYGVTREYVLGLEAMLGGGERLQCGRRTAKGCVGYDMTGLFVGSEGTLGVITQVFLKILPAPRAFATLVAMFRDTVSAGEASTRILRSGCRPCALELVDGPSIAALRDHGDMSFPAGVAGLLLCEIDGEPEALERLMATCGAICEAAGAIEVNWARDADERRQLWTARRAVYPTLLAAYPRLHVEDVCVPRARVPDILRRIDELSAVHAMPTATIAHAGDGNLHVGMLASERGGDDEQRRLDALISDLLRAVLDMGGTIAGEHGIGIRKRTFLHWELSQGMIAVQRKIKAVLDPRGLLNPGKIFNEERIDGSTH